MKPAVTACCALLLLLATEVCPAAAERPNVVVILVDDMGFSDIGCYGSEIPTPNLDALARNGLRFTQFYNTGRCCPTRTALLTGLYQHQSGVGHMTGDYGVPGYRGFLNNSCVTLGTIAHSAGYLATAAGKWHVGHKDASMRPLARGFDRFYGIPEGGGFYFKVKPGRTILLNEELVASPTKQVPDGWYSTDAFTAYGLKFIDEAVAAKKPFLLYLAHNAPHFPLQADAEDIAMFRGKYRAGWDQLSRARHERQLAMGLLDNQWPKSARPGDVRAWDALSEKERDRFDHIMAVYAACIHRMDRSVGTLVDGLKTRGILDDTLLLFMSDNGGCAESGPNGRDTGDPTTPNSNWFCGKSWAWMQDTPFRKFKHYNHEGGIATPLIVHWPNGFAARGECRRQPAHVIDVMATLVDVTGATYPAKRNGSPVLPPEGVSLLPVFANRKIAREALYWEHEGNAAVRRGDWKLVRLGGKGAWELYNLKNDRTEQNDLAGKNPQIVKELKHLWLAWAKRCNVAPTGLPRKRKARRPVSGKRSK